MLQGNYFQSNHFDSNYFQIDEAGELLLAITVIASASGSVELERVVETFRTRTLERGLRFRK